MSQPRTPHAIRLRRARLADVPDLVEIERTSFQHESERFDARRIRRLIRNPRAVVSVASRPGQGIVGWSAGLVRRSGQHISGRIYALAVHPNAQGLSVGRKLLSRLIRCLRHVGVKRIYLEVRTNNGAAIALYRKMGFAELRRLPGYYSPGRHALRMCLEPALLIRTMVTPP